jgi:hypothetical protein
LEVKNENISKFIFDDFDTSLNILTSLVQIINELSLDNQQNK